MAAVFPLDTSQPWINNGVEYRYDATEDRWFMASKTDTSSPVVVPEVPSTNTDTDNSAVLRGLQTQITDLNTRITNLQTQVIPPAVVDLSSIENKIAALENWIQEFSASITRYNS